MVTAPPENPSLALFPGLLNSICVSADRTKMIDSTGLPPSISLYGDSSAGVSLPCFQNFSVMSMQPFLPPRSSQHNHKAAQYGSHA